MKIVVGYLRRLGQPLAMLDQFLDSYRAHDAGIAHELHVIMKGIDDDVPPFPSLRISDEGFDITGYVKLSRAVPADAYVFLNSYSRILCRDWLRHLVDGLEHSALVGATGSWECAFGDQRFPNAHIRTNAFAVEAAFWNGVAVPPMHEKVDASMFEAGPRSLTRQAILAGYEPIVVDAHGSRWHARNWKHAAVFRVREQEDLMIADNRTDHYQHADAANRAGLARLAWGTSFARPEYGQEFRRPLRF
jgi:hypothetical protein